MDGAVWKVMMLRMITTASPAPGWLIKVTVAHGRRIRYSLLVRHNKICSHIAHGRHRYGVC
jgi:hypothetical protein